MLPTTTMRRLLVVFAILLLLPAVAAAEPLETDLGTRLATALTAHTGSLRLAFLLALLGGLATS